jgi:DNA-binding transcriptional regulator YdaS (Cro superfamily)
MDVRTPTEALRGAVDHFGSAAGLATALEVSKQAISFWLSGARRIPADKCPAIERATLGRVRCEELRPDVPWDVLRQQAASPLVAVSSSARGQVDRVAPVASTKPDDKPSRRRPRGEWHD